MNNNWQINEFDGSSKIWMYTIEPELNSDQQATLENELHLFCTQWTAHNKELRAFFKLIQNRILILGVDEHLNPASGCSIDKSIHFLEEMEKKYSIEVFNRMLFTYLEGDHLITLPKKEFEKALTENKINSKTKVINTLALSLKDWNANGVLHLEDSWMKNFFGVTA